MRHHLIALTTTGLVALTGWYALTGPANTADARPVVNAATTLAADTYEVDGVHSAVVFRIMHMGAAPFWGRFNSPSGTITFDPDHLSDASFDVSVKVENVDTANEGRDKHLKNNDFFSARQFPNITFKSSSVKKGSKKNMYVLTGDLEMHGVTKEITAEAEFFGRNETSRGVKAGFEVTFTVKRSDFNMHTYTKEGGLGDEVKLIAGLELNG